MKLPNLKEIPIIYTLETTGLAGGHKIVFEHITNLYKRGYDVHLWALSGQPAWYDLPIKVGHYPHYLALQQNLKDFTAIKVATWWKTAKPVWESVLEGKGWAYYFIQDIETSYYPESSPATEPLRKEVLETYTYRPMRIMTTSDWVTKQVRERFKCEADQIHNAIDLEVYMPNAKLVKKPIVTVLGRSHHLKNWGMTFRVIDRVKDEIPGLQVQMFGLEQLVLPIQRTFYFNPTDNKLVSLYQQSRVYLSTSNHEGFCLPILEAMACGCPVVCTAADGNEEYCRDGENCLMFKVDDDDAMVKGLHQVLTNDRLADKLREGGLKTAKKYNWDWVTNLLIKSFSRIYDKPEGVK